MKVNKNIASAIFFILLSLIIWIAIPYQIQVIDNSIINAQFLPKLITIVIFALSLILLVASIVKSKQKTDGDIITLKLGEELKVVATFILLLGYAFVMPFVGFIASSIVVCGIVLLISNVKKWSYYIVTFSIVIIIYYVFKLLLKVQLP